uniref:Gfo/Idh/MocA family oxidoreductase n=1 Tax=Ignisphaera aggregans TaxID=334771 RepID=A0A7C4D475_9CREN
MVKLGIVGLGVMGTRFYNLLRKMNVEVVAVCDIDETKLKAFKSEGIKVYRDYRAMAEEGGFDGVIIAVPPLYHAEHAIEFLSKGYYVFLEKPMANDIEGAKRILDIAKGKNRLFVGYCLKFNKLYQKVKNVIDNVLGEPKFMWHIALGRFPQRSWIYSKSISGGVLIEHGSHVVHVFYWYGGSVKKVYANMTYNSNDVEKAFTIILEHFSGTLSTFTLSWFGGHNWRKWGIDGEKGRIVVEGYLEGEFSVSSPDGTMIMREVVSMDPIHMYEEELKHFIDAIERGDRFLVDEEEAFVVQKIIDAAYRSSQEGKAVYL